jgi:hypothetical protein
MRDKYLDHDTVNYDDAHAPGGRTALALGWLTLIGIVLILFLSSETGQAVMDYIDGVKQ